jgi:signal peptidase I
MSRKRWLLIIGVLVAIVAITPAYVRAFRVFGASDAPSFLVGDRVIVNQTAYDLRLPYAGTW